MTITKEKLYQHFGPKLLDAVVQVLKDEVNILRQEAGWPERTHQQVLDAIDQKLKQIPNYPWMNKNP